MEDAYNVDPNASEPVKTSSTDSKDNSKTTGDSQVQDGEGVITHDHNTEIDNTDDPEEYINQANNNTEVANEDPVQNGKGMTMLAPSADDDNDEDDDDDDDPSDEPEIGDDPDETKKKIPVF